MPPSRSPTLGSSTLLPVPRSYWQASRAPRYSLLFALPLLVVYEVLAALLAGGPADVRNGADVMLKAAFAAVAGPWGPVVFGLVLIGGSLWLVHRDRRRSGGALRRGVFAGMLAESVLLALLLGGVVAGITAQLLGPLGVLAIGQVESLSAAERLMLSLGAGLYEELLFRVVLVTALAFLARRVLGLGVWTAGAVAVVVGAFLFSLVHYVGPFGDPFQLTSFTFRFVAGLVFSAMYLLRGFGITAWTHALYDVMVLML